MGPPGFHFEGPAGRILGNQPGPFLDLLQIEAAAQHGGEGDNPEHPLQLGGEFFPVAFGF